jgi:hypothetical protein
MNLRAGEQPQQMISFACVSIIPQNIQLLESNVICDIPWIKNTLKTGPGSAIYSRKAHILYSHQHFMKGAIREDHSSCFSPGDCSLPCCAQSAAGGRVKLRDHVAKYLSG